MAGTKPGHDEKGGERMLPPAASATSMRLKQRKPDRDPGASRWRFLDRQGAAMGFGQAAGDGEAQSGAARSAASRCLQPTERLEHGLSVFGRDSHAFVVDRQQKVLVDDHAAKMGPAAEIGR